MDGGTFLQKMMMTRFVFVKSKLTKPSIEMMLHTHAIWRLILRGKRSQYFILRGKRSRYSLLGR